MRYTWMFIIPPIAVAAIIFVAWYRYRMHSHDRDLRRVAVIAHTKTIKMLPAYRKAVLRYRILLACAAISFLASLFTLTAAAARPTDRVKNDDTESENRDVVLCLDISGSMNRYQNEILQYFKNIAGGLKKQRLAVTIFDGRPANLIPLTDDYDALLDIIDMLTIDNDEKSTSMRSSYDSPISAYSVMGTSSSAIGDGVMGCVNSLDLSADNLRAKSVIIATDNAYGDNTQSVDIGQVARYAERYGVTFYGIYIPSYNARQKNEFINATKITNGMFYDLEDYYDVINGEAVAKDSEKTTVSIIREIMAQETAKMKGAPEIIYTDYPNIYLYISGICFVVFAILIWRLRL